MTGLTFVVKLLPPEGQQVQLARILDAALIQAGATTAVPEKDASD